ncbi:MAG: hypothetical protein QM645_04960 [Asticcacaulis sp.]
MGFYGLILILGVTGLSATTAHSQTVTEADYYQIPLKLPEKAAVRQVILKTTQTRQNDQSETATFKGEYISRFTPDKEGYRVTKTTVSSNLILDGDVSDEKSADMQKLSAALADVGEITYIADPNLTPLRIADWPRLRRGIKQSMRKAGLMKQKQEAAFDALYERITPEAASELFLPEDGLLAIPRNLGLSLEKPYILESTIAAPFGGEPLRTRETLKLTRWDEAGQKAYLTYLSGPAKADLDAYAKAIQPELDTAARLDAEQYGLPYVAVNEVHLELSTRCNYEMSLKTGLVLRAACLSIRDVRIGEQIQSQRESWSMSESFVE